MPTGLPTARVKAGEIARPKRSPDLLDSVSCCPEVQLSFGVIKPYFDVVPEFGRLPPRANRSGSPYSVRRPDIVLLDHFQHFEMHVRPAHRFADCFGILGVVIVDFDVGFDELRRKQLNRTASSLRHPSPLMRSTACFIHISHHCYASVQSLAACDLFLLAGVNPSGAGLPAAYWRYGERPFPSPAAHRQRQLRQSRASGRRGRIRR